MARILIADDSHVARKILRNMVVAQGHVVIGEVANGTQAFVEYTKLKPDDYGFNDARDGRCGSYV